MMRSSSPLPYGTPATPYVQLRLLARMLSEIDDIFVILSCADLLAVSAVMSEARRVYVRLNLAQGLRTLIHEE